MPYIEEISTAGRSIQPLPTSVTGFVGSCGQGPIDTPVTVTSPAEYHATFGPSLDGTQPLGHAVDLFFANGGTSATVVRAAGPEPEQLIPTAGGGGVHALDDVGVTVLAIPGLTAAHPLQVAHALNWCAERRAVLLLDLPDGQWGAATQAAAGQAGPHRERAAVYHPWVTMGGVAIPPSGAVAGVVARTDATRGVWKAPANVAVYGIDGVVETIDDAGGQLLTQHGVNPIREFPGRGWLVWGARTLAGVASVEPPRRYLSIRRLVDHISASLSAGLGFAVFEPSEAALWARVRMLAEEFLRDLWRRGALQGATAEEAFGVRCGLGETMTQADIEAGRLVLTAYVATLKPAEFDVLTVRVAMLTAPDDADDQEPGIGEQPAPGRYDVVSRSRSVDLSGLASRYIGETEKNLRRVFDAARRTGEVLFFDEADALFGKRTGVRDSHDRFSAQEGRRLIAKLAREYGVEVRWRRHRR